MDKKTVFAAIAGRPNTGKSTLLNALLNEKISIVSKKPQTTRNKITGILTKDISETARAQYVFFDTPGAHLPKSRLGRYMTGSIKTALSGVDAAILVVEAEERIGAPERGIFENLKKTQTPVILVINKIDITAKDKLLPVIQLYSREYDPEAILPVSALTGDGVELVFSELNKYLTDIEPGNEFFFPEDMVTDQPERRIAAEIIREKTLRLLMDEVPHGVGVAIEEFKEQKSKNLLNLRAEIFCERETHKRIIIGRNGEMIKKIGSFAREDLEEFFGCRVYLDLWVKVKREWRDKQSVLAELGYNERDL
ncbi:MAG: GTPase Era [Oscillospiraceae bacterium]|nr:GTPase Era [Oscillospiraceae bacterium]